MKTIISQLTKIHVTYHKRCDHVTHHKNHVTHLKPPLKNNISTVYSFDGYCTSYVGHTKLSYLLLMSSSWDIWHRNVTMSHITKVAEIEVVSFSAELIVLRSRLKRQSCLTAFQCIVLEIYEFKCDHVTHHKIMSRITNPMCCVICAKIVSNTKITYFK